MDESCKLSGRRRSIVFQWSLLATTLVWAPGALLGQGYPIGGQAEINAYTTSTTKWTVVAPATSGRFLVVWEGYGSFDTDSDFTSIQGRFVGSDGVPVGGQIQINTFTTSAQSRPAVAATPDGGFVVVWQSYGSPDTDSSGYSIQGQLLASTGGRVGVQFQVNTFTPSIQKEAAVAVQDDGSFIVAWSSNGSGGSDSSSLSIQAQRFLASGVRDDIEFQVNTHTTGLQNYPAVEIIASNDFVVVWDGPGAYGTDTSGSSIHAQRYESDGTDIEGEFQINSYTTNDQYIPALNRDEDGNFVVVWSSFGSGGDDASGSSVQARRFDSSGGSIGNDIQVNTTTLDNQKPAVVSVYDQGEFVVNWRSDASAGTDSSNTSIQGQSFKSDGTLFGGEFQVNTYTTDSQRYPAVAIQGNGDFVVAWTSYGSYGSDSSSSSIQGQIFVWQLFADGVESGNTSQWSATVP